MELNLRFPDITHVEVRLDDNDSGSLDFANPLHEKDLRDIRWYVETYGAHSLGDPDDKEAARIAAQLPQWGEALFDAVFGEREAQRLFNDFQNAENETRLLTIGAEDPAILALPWELLHDSASGGAYLSNETPRISIRRRVAGITGGRAAFKVVAKDRLHVLFVVSRPKDAGFLDPRSDPGAVLDALEHHAPGRVTWEFLRPPTLDALVERLEDAARLPVDVLHFDGHGVFDRPGGLPEQFEKDKASRFGILEEILRERKAAPPDLSRYPPKTGYLLFETDKEKCHFVSADQLGENLNRHKVALVILSACQSADVGAKETEGSESDGGNPGATDGEGEKRPMGCVAVRLTGAGIPAALAMTHSVLVPTTRALFGEFYKNLAKNKGIGESLDNARRHLANHPEKYDVQRGPKRVPLCLHDWFLPALYVSGADAPLLKPLPAGAAPAPPVRRDWRRLGETPDGRLSMPPEAGFFGRRRELWEIERAFAGPTRRVSITGFGGQGKSELAQEAGRWLTRAGMFRHGVFVDYSRVQGRDAVAVAVGCVAKVLGETLIDAAAAAEALRRAPTLVILDNLEALDPEPLRELLDVAVEWSEAGGSRVLCTSRRPDFGHPRYRVEGTLEHRRMPLDGLGSRKAPEDALEWFAALFRLPPAPTVGKAPEREALINLFDKVRFHPLSIRVLAQQLKTRGPAELGERLEQLLAGSAAASPAAGATEDTPAGLIASLQLSLDHLDDAARKVLPRLGVFQGGAMESDLLAITGMGDSSNIRKQLEDLLAAVERGDAGEVLKAMGLPVGDAIPRELLDQVKAGLPKIEADLKEKLSQLPAPSGEANLWPALRRQLESAALVEAETVPGVGPPFLRFHPTLSPILWAQLGADERERLRVAHRKRYYALAKYLYKEDQKNPHQARAIAWRELPNLLHGVHAALDAGDLDAVDFADSINLFLGTIFGLKRESEALSAKAQAAAGEVGSKAWVMAQSNRGDQLLSEGRVADAAKVFQTLLDHLGDAPSYERAVTLHRLGRCFRAAGRPDLAEQHHRAGLTVVDQLEPSEDVKRERGVLLTDLADVLRDQGRYAEARKEYEKGLEIAREQDDLRQQGVVLGQLGTLAMQEGNLDEALKRYRAALALFQTLREPAMETAAWHQLGRVFQEARQWDESERHYRESARINEERGDRAGAARTWNNLALVTQNAGKPEAAEMWYRKAIEGFRAIGDKTSPSKCLNNLADLLQNQPRHLDEARKLAEESLDIKQTLDPGAAEIWTTYNILAQIADKEATAASDPSRKSERQSKARDYRRLAREAKRNFAGTRPELRRLAPLILTSVMACSGDKNAREALAQHQAAMRQGGEEWTVLASALDRLLSGERDREGLVADLGPGQSMIIEAILDALADPSTLRDLLPSEGPKENDKE